MTLCRPKLTTKGIQVKIEEAEKEIEKEKTKEYGATALWPKNTVLISGNSMLRGIEEK